MVGGRGVYAFLPPYFESELKKNDKIIKQNKTVKVRVHLTDWRRMSCVRMLTDDPFGLKDAELTDKAIWSVLKKFCSSVTNSQSQFSKQSAM